LTAAIDASVPQEGRVQIALRNMFLLGPNPGEPTPAGSSLALYGVLINQVIGRADRLASVSSPLFAGARIDGGAVQIPAAQPDGEGGLVKLHDEGALNTAEPSPDRGDEPETPPPAEAGETSPQPTGPGATGQGQPRVVLQDLNKELVAGALVPVRLQFEKAGAATIRIPLVPRQQEYATYPLASPAQPTQPGTATPRPNTGQTPGTEQTAGREQGP
jgi:hypothetical protein